MCSFQAAHRARPPAAQVNLTTTEFQKYNYMRPEPGAIKDEYVQINPRV